MNCGVPMGSIRGPLLFIIYINDLSVYLNECKVTLYADTALYAASSSYIDLMLSLRIDMSSISRWLKMNKLTLNVNQADDFWLPEIIEHDTGCKAQNQWRGYRKGE